MPPTPEHAFTVFTDELDLWWVRRPTNAYDSGRLIEMRCEPGVGGRILEVYDGQACEGLELARITVWEPGRRLAWKRSLDDMSILVRFDPTTRGTLVTLEATVWEGGDDRGGSSFVQEIAHHGFSSYVARDLEGRCWRFAQARPTRPR